MLKALVLTIDVEPDDPNWNGPVRSNKASDSLGNLNRLACMANWMQDFDLKPTLLATYSAVTSALFENVVERLARYGDIEIGMHMHPAETPPFLYVNRDSFDNILSLNDDVLLAKLENQFKEMARRFDAPRSFRGAAWAIDRRVFRWLAQSGFAVDTSITPGIDWRMRQRPDWSDAPAHPYRVNLTYPTVEDPDSCLVEVPPSICSYHRLPNWTKAIPGLRSIMTQPLKSSRSKVVDALRLLRPQEPRWLRPALESDSGLVEVSEALGSVECMHVMIHSNELEPGASPYSRTHDETNSLRARLGRLIERLAHEGWQPMTLTEFAESWLSQKSVSLTA